MRPVPAAVLTLVHEFEQGPDGGFAARQYDDPAGIPTIGWGHRLYPGDPLIGATISAEEADATALEDMSVAATAICTTLGGAVNPLTDNQYAAIIDFTFNLGQGAFAGSTLCSLIKVCAYYAASLEFPKWVHAGGKVLPGLVRRRAAEQALWEYVNIVPIAFVDTWAFSSTLFARYKDRFSGDHPSMSLLPLRSEAGPLPLLGEWKSAKALLSRVRNAAAVWLGGAAEMGTAAVVQVCAGGFIEWQVEPSLVYRTLHLPVVPSPGAWVYSGGEGAVLPVGQLTWVNRAVPWSAINLGDHPVIHLVVDVKAPDEPE